VVHLRLSQWAPGAPSRPFSAPRLPSGWIRDVAGPAGGGSPPLILGSHLPFGSREFFQHLRQQVSDFFMHVAQEVDVRRGAVHAPIFHQEVLEHHLQLVPLRNYHQLQKTRMSAI